MARNNISENNSNENYKTKYGQNKKTVKLQKLEKTGSQRHYLVPIMTSTQIKTLTIDNNNRVMRHTELNNPIEANIVMLEEKQNKEELKPIEISSLST